MSLDKQSRREFMQWASAAGFGAFVLSATRGWGLEAIENPLAFYPNREWERTYRDLFRWDSTFHFLCAPNDTHNCLLKAYVRSGVVTRIGPSMRYGEAPISSATVLRTAGIRASARRVWRSPGASTATGGCATRWCAPGSALGGSRLPARRRWPAAARILQPGSRRVGARDHEEAADIVARAIVKHRRDLQRRGRGEAARASTTTR